jgi:hypothetical protein
MSQTAWRYEVLDDDERFGLKQGDVIVGVPYVYDPGHRNNPDGKISILWREGDDHRPESNQYWYSLRRLRGRVPIEWDDELKGWRRPDPRKRPPSRAKRNRRLRVPTRGR